MCSTAPERSTGTICLFHKLQEQGRHPVAGALVFLCGAGTCPPSGVTTLWQSKRWAITIFWQWHTGNTHPSSHFPSWQNTAVTAAQSWVSLSQVTRNQSLPAAFLIHSDISVIMIFTVMFMILVFFLLQPRLPLFVHAWACHAIQLQWSQGLICSIIITESVTTGLSPDLLPK